jgi:hypothetical protein
MKEVMPFVTLQKDSAIKKKSKELSVDEMDEA